MNTLWHSCPGQRSKQVATSLPVLWWTCWCATPSCRTARPCSSDPTTDFEFISFAIYVNWSFGVLRRFSSQHLLFTERIYLCNLQSLLLMYCFSICVRLNLCNFYCFLPWRLNCLSLALHCLCRLNKEHDTANITLRTHFAMKDEEEEKWERRMRPSVEGRTKGRRGRKEIKAVGIEMNENPYIFNF